MPSLPENPIAFFFLIQITERTEVSSVLLLMIIACLSKSTFGRVKFGGKMFFSIICIISVYSTHQMKIDFVVHASSTDVESPEQGDAIQT